MAIASLLACTTGCAIGPVYGPRIEGKVVEKDTGKPVAGAEVFAAYEVNSPSGVHYIDWRWATTEEDGSFAIPGHIWVILGPPGGRTESYPVFRVIHREYGEGGTGFTGRAAEDFPGWQNISLEVGGGPRGYFEDPIRWSSLCRGASDAACDRMCEVIYGSVDACARYRH